MYVKGVEKFKMVLHIFAHNFLNIQLILNLQKVLKSWDLGLSNYCELLSTPSTYKALQPL